jgi:hypothetical protein
MQDAAKALELGHHLTQLRILPDRQMTRILKGGIQVQFKSDLNHAT